MRKFVFALSLFLLVACGNKESDLDLTNPDAFIEDLSKHFDTEEVNSYVDESRNQTIYELGEFTVTVNEANELEEMYAASDKETFEEAIHFMDLPLPKEYEELEPGQFIDTTGDRAYASISRNHEGMTETAKELAEQGGRPFDETKDHNLYIKFQGLEE